MRKYLFLLALAVACGSESHGDDDDDDNGGDGGHSGTSSGRGGKASTGGRAGTSTAAGAAGRAVGGASGATAGTAGTSMGGSGALAGANATGGRGGVGTSGSGPGDSGNGGFGGDDESNAGMGGVGAEAGAGSSNAGSGGTGGSAGLGGIGGGSGTSGTAGSVSTGGGGAGGLGGLGGGGHGGVGGVGGVGGAVYPIAGAGGQTSGTNLPVVELLVDGSSSMFEQNNWGLVYQSLVTDGVLAAFEGALNLGVAVYQGKQGTSESDPACAQWTDVTFAGDNAGEIGNTLAAVGNAYTLGTKWETPTGYAVNVAAQTLDDYAASGGVRKYILLVTDGAPNTCQVLDPQCGQDLTVLAVQNARALGVTTLVVGVGSDSLLQGCPTNARCGDQHLQDVANAGVGLPVEPPPDGYRFNTCVKNSTLLASYASVGGGGSATFYSSAQTGGLTARLTAALTAIAAGTLP